MSHRPIIEDRAGLEAVYADLRPIMDLSARLPASPFRRTGTDSLCEFERFRGGTFGPLLAALADQYNDEYVSGVSVDPDPEYYHEFYETFGAFRISASGVASAYWDALSYQPSDDATGALLFAADVLCVAGSSGSWAIWGERQIGVAVVRTDRSDLSWRQGSNLFVSPVAALRDFVEPNFNREPLPEDFREAFLRGFQSTDGPLGGG
jgi:hypothetical protein